MQDETFFRYVRGVTDEVPQGHTKNGCDLYRHLVYLGVDQMLTDCFPQVREGLGEAAWETLLRHFIATTQWSSNFYGDLEDEFIEYLSSAGVPGSDVSGAGVP